ncbi:hypothetical protein BJ165DRAFT_429096 [Panaeolus papilionaceus]|nr:hypothetical protein BJ165DRAFT_429096 [Panaeolus papilionaceus]
MYQVGKKDQTYSNGDPLQSLPVSLVSLPLSLFALDGCYSVVGDGNLSYEPEVHGEAIQCNDCRSWSHVGFRQLNDSVIPSKRWIDATKKSPQRDVVPYVGDLSLVEHAQIANWFDEHTADKHG